MELAAACARAWTLACAEVPDLTPETMRSGWKIPVKARDGARWSVTSTFNGILLLDAPPAPGWARGSRPAREEWRAGLRLCVRLVDDAQLPLGDQIVGVRRLLQACPEVVYEAANVVGCAEAFRQSLRTFGDQRITRDEVLGNTGAPDDIVGVERQVDFDSADDVYHVRFRDGTPLRFRMSREDLENGVRPVDRARELKARQNAVEFRTDDGMDALRYTV